MNRNGQPNHCARTDQPPNLAVHCPCLTVYYEQGIVRRAYHVATEYTTLYYRPVGITPLCQRRRHRLAHASNHLHFTCETVMILIRRRGKERQDKSIHTCSQVQEQNILLVCRRSVQITSVGRLRRVKCNVADVQRGLYVE